MAKKLIMMALGAVLLFSACEVNEPIYDTSHPEQGQIVKLTTDWTGIGTGISIPPTYTVKVGGLGTTNGSIQHYQQPVRLGDLFCFYL